MFRFRKIFKILRGQVTPFQVVSACMLGGAMGFLPGFAQAPGLVVALVLILVLLNANLLLAGLTGSLAALLSLALLPVSFHLGRALLDGPAQPAFAALINAPLTALLGLEYYATTGGLLLGGVIGAVLGASLVGLLRLFRVRMAAMEEGSERYQRWTGKKWVRALTWVLIGSGPKAGYKAMLEARKRRQPFRPLGLVAALGVAVLAVLVTLLASGPIVTAALQAGLERANGATVDLDRAELSFRQGRLVMEGLAMADPNALETDLVRAGRLEATLSIRDLLRKRVAMDRLVVSDASTGQRRRLPGWRSDRLPPPAPAPAEPDAKTLDDYLADAQTWKDRLAQVRRWMENLSGADADTAEQPETLRDRLARQARELGYAHVRADHLIAGAPAFLVREVLAERVRVEALDDETLDIEARNLSTHPALVEGAPELTIRSSGGTLRAEVLLAEAAQGGGGRDNRIRLALRNLAGDRIGSALAVGGTRPVQGGTMDLDSEGTWRRGLVDLPLHVTIRDATLAVHGVGSKQVSRFELPLGIRGPLDNPSVLVNEQALTDALVKAGATELTQRARAEAQRAVGAAVERVVNQAGDSASERIGQEAGGTLRRLIGGREGQ